MSGNVEFPASVDIVVHENTAANMKKMAPVTGFPPPAKPTPSIFGQNEGRGLPDRTYKDRLTLGSGADQVDLRYYGRGHTVHTTLTRRLTCPGLGGNLPQSPRPAYGCATGEKAP